MPQCTVLPVQLRMLDERQPIALSLFQDKALISSKDLQNLFRFKDRTARDLCSNWVESGFLSTEDPSKKSRKYRLSGEYEGLVR